LEVNTFLGETYMLWLLLALVAVGAFIWWVNRDEKIDSNDDGKVDVSEAKAAVEKAVSVAKAAADVNKDGKVNVADVKEAGKKVKAGAKKAAAKVKKPKLKVAK
jgi:copper chaperone CopZ